MKVYQADFRGNDAYYTPEDLMWEIVPTTDDPGATTPRPGAVPRDAQGNPLESETPQCSYCGEPMQPAEAVPGCYVCPDRDCGSNDPDWGGSHDSGRENFHSDG